jgi:hypothetical protein
MTPKEIDDILREIPVLKSLSKTALEKLLRVKHDVRKKEFDLWLATSDDAQRLPFMLEQVPSRKIVKRRAIVKKIAMPSYSFQIDVVKPGWRARNRATLLLLLVEVNSRRMFARALKNNTATHVTSVYESIMNDEVLPAIPPVSGEPDTKSEALKSVHIVHGDKFFDNKSFQEYNERKGIEVTATVAKDDHMSRTGNKLGIVDRATRTLKDMLRRYADAEDNTNWTSYLDKIVDAYNNKPHDTLKGHSPNELYDDRGNLALLYESNVAQNDAADIQAEGVRLPVGTKVRLIRERRALEKGGARLSPEVYVVKSNPTATTYVLENATTGVELKRRPRLDDVVKVSDRAVDVTNTKRQRSRDQDKTRRRLRRERL